MMRILETNVNYFIFSLIEYDVLKVFLNHFSCDYTQIFFNYYYRMTIIYTVK
jgi:hypothetical protein